MSNKCNSIFIDSYGRKWSYVLDEFCNSHHIKVEVAYHQNVCERFREDMEPDKAYFHIVCRQLKDKSLETIYEAYRQYPISDEDVLKILS